MAKGENEVMDRLIKFIFIFVAAGFLLTIAVSSVLAEKSIKEDTLKFQIVFDKTVFEVGEHVTCKMVLTNAGKKPVTVNCRFLVNWPSPSPHEVYFVIKNDKGIELPFQLRIKAGSPKQKHFITLNPGQNIKSTDSFGIIELESYDLTEAYDLKNPGAYSIFAVYENKTEPEGMKVWVGKLISNTIKITIKK